MDCVSNHKTSKIYKASKEMETRELLKLAFYVMAANFYRLRSSRHLTKTTLLDHKAEDYVEKQKEILRKKINE